MIDPATRWAVVKSAELRFMISVGAVAKGLSTVRSTVAPLGMRPELVAFTVTREPSAPSAPKPLTNREPWARA